MQRIFVIGCPRSGTTLVQALLARHPDVFSLQETYFFEALLGDALVRWADREARPTRKWYHRAGLAQSWGRHRLRELEDAHLASRAQRTVPRRWRACIRRYVAMLDEAAGSKGRSHWVEKTPNHLLFIDEIAACVPDARFVHVLRNGIDVVASVLDEDMRQSTAAFRGGIAQWTWRWNHAMELHMARLGEPRHHLLCLEDLVADQSGEWERLRDFSRLDPGKSLLPRPGCLVADAELEPWKREAMTGVVKPANSKVQAMLGPQSLTWLQQHLVDYRAIRDAVHKQSRAVVD
ncbi:MAG: sulfotransferase family protein [Rhodanobacteraceae bacterium]